MTVNTLMDEEQLGQWILRRFGAPLLKVELTECHLKDAITEAKNWFSAKKGIVKQALMAMQSGVTEYTLPDEVDTVLDVAFPVPPMDISMVFSPFVLIDDKVPYDVFAAPSSIGIYSSFTQTLQYVEMAKRVLGAEPDWRQEQRKLYLFPMPKNDSSIVIWFKSNSFTVDQLNERDHDLLKRYAMAIARRDLGEIRSKYDSYPTAQGSVTLNGASLIQRAEAEIAALNEEIIQSGYPMLFMTG